MSHPIPHFTFHISYSTRYIILHIWHSTSHISCFTFLLPYLIIYPTFNISSFTSCTSRFHIHYPIICVLYFSFHISYFTFNIPLSLCNSLYPTIYISYSTLLRSIFLYLIFHVSLFLHCTSCIPRLVPVISFLSIIEGHTYKMLKKLDDPHETNIRYLIKWISFAHKLISGYLQILIPRKLNIVAHRFATKLICKHL